MTNEADIARLVLMVERALTEAEQQGSTLAAALLTECIEAIKRQRILNRSGFVGESNF